MRLTAELVAQSSSFINPLKQRELDLRGHQIPTIENLGVTKDQQECLDLTDNAITSLNNFPKLLHLTTLLVAHNRIQTINPNLADSLPNLQTLVLTSNAIQELFELTPLQRCAKLEFLTLMDCPVQRKGNYRLWMIYLCPRLRLLDYRKVKDAERAQAKKLFQTANGEPNDLYNTYTSQRTTAKTFNPDTPMDGAITSRAKLTAEERKKIEEAIMNAKDLREVQRLESFLREGRIPD